VHGRPAAFSANGQHGFGCCDKRISAVAHRHGAGMVSATGEPGQEAFDARDCGHDADRGVIGLQDGALLDM